MRRLVPTLGDVDPVGAYGRLGRLGPSRPGVRLNMIASVDGAASLDGRSGTLGGPADRALFAVLRSLADVIVVGAGTLRAEGYGPVRLDERARERRRRWGLSAVPPIAVVTRTCRLEWGSPFFTEAEQRPLVLTVATATAAERERAAEVAEVGPAVAAELAAAGLLDELCLTVSPLLAGGDGHRMLAGPALAPPGLLELVHVLEADGYLFLRYRRR
jgi:riboflavin biosynthesis pyrimidine reductase